MNKQPFYHRCDSAILFTGTRPVSKKEFIAALEKALKPLGLVKGTVEIEDDSGWMEPEAGDPSDLM